MGEVINLRRARKARERAGRDAEADANRAKFGRSKAERAGSEAEADLTEKRLDAHKRDMPPDDG